jgi:uncharacterized protein (UPF0335 family)
MSYHCPLRGPPSLYNEHAGAKQADILDHRQEQIKAEEVKLRSLVAQIERLEGELARNAEDNKELRDANSQQAARLNDAAALLQVWGVIVQAWLIDCRHKECNKLFA